jgi:hypothetical protein
MWFVILIRNSVYYPHGNFKSEVEAAVWAAQRDCDSYLVRRLRAR